MKKSAILNFNDNKIINNNIINASILSLIINNIESENGERYQLIANLTWLCRDSFDNLFILNSNYYLDDELEKYVLSTYPFYWDNLSINTKNNIILIMNKLPVYTTDFNFYYNEKVNNTKSFYLNAIRLKDNNFSNIKIPFDIFIAFTYIDYYISNCIIDNHTLNNCLEIAFEPNDNATIFEVEDILCINKIYRVNKLSNTVAAIFTVTNKTGDNITIFNIFEFESEIKVPKFKFKKFKMEKIIPEFLKENKSYNYISNLSYSVLFKDNEYFIIKCKNIMKDNKIILLSEKILDKLNKKIIELF